MVNKITKRDNATTHLASLNNFIYLIRWFGLWCVMPLSTILQFYRGG
jgi:hypothetical protein